jgi:hypothetical protein
MIKKGMGKKSSEFPEYLALRLDPDTRNRIVAIARAEERSPGALARILLKEALEHRNKKPSKKKKPAP